jgi:hypothetical protein
MMRRFGQKRERSAGLPNSVPQAGIGPGGVVTDCYCGNGHNLVNGQTPFDGHPGIVVRLNNTSGEGLLTLSPVLGDLRREFSGIEPVRWEIVDISCPVCRDPLPIYDLCNCGAPLVSLFLTPTAEFSSCIGICQRIGCLHSKIKSTRELRLFSRLGYFESDRSRGSGD